MASFEWRDAPALYFQPRLPKGQRYKSGTLNHILWPALMYRVVAPEVRERQLDIFEKAVLGLCQAGVNTYERIGRALHLHKDLAAVICKLLTDRHLLSSNGLPTPLGIETLTEELLDSQNMVTGFIFKDPFTGELWPRFRETLDIAELDYSSPSGFPDLVLGSKGTPRRKFTFSVMPGRVSDHSAPTQQQIFEATRRHKRAFKYAGEYELADADDVESSQDQPEVVERISYIDDTPQPVWLASFMYLPEAPDLAGDWFAADPFGLGVSPRLRKYIEREMPNNMGLRGVLENMLGKSLDEQRAGQQNVLGELELEAKTKLQKALGAKAARLSHYGELVAMQRKLGEVELIGEHCPSDKLEDVGKQARKATEGTFIHLFKQYPNHNAWKRLFVHGKPHHREDLKRIYEEAVKVLGFKTPLPEPLAFANPGHVKAVCVRDNIWNLRGVVIAAVLSARDDPTHPLRQAARIDPDLLAKIDSIAARAGDMSHARNGKEQLKVTLKDASAMVADTLHVVRLLCDLS